MMTSEHQYIPPLTEQLQRIGVHRLLVCLATEALIAYADTAVQLDGIDDRRQVLLTRRHILQQDAVLHRRTVRECHVHCQRRHQPLLYAAVGKHAVIGDMIHVGALPTFDDNAEHIEDGITVAVERCTRQRVALCHLVSHPTLVDLLERHPLVPLQRRQQPRILMEYIRLFHTACKGSHFSPKQEIKSRKTYFTLAVVQPFVVAMTDEHGENILTLTMQDVIDGIVTRDVFYLTTAEVILRSQRMHIQFAEVRDHRVPDAGTSLLRRFLELDLIEESAFEGLIHIFLQVGGGDHDTLECLHLLQDDVLQRVLHLIDGILRPTLSLADDGICLIKQ